MRYAGRYLAAAVRLEVIALEEIRRGNLTSEQVDLRDRAEANQAGIVAALTPQSILNGRDMKRTSDDTGAGPTAITGPD